MTKAQTNLKFNFVIMFYVLCRYWASPKSLHINFISKILIPPLIAILPIPRVSHQILVQSKGCFCKHSFNMFQFFIVFDRIWWARVYICRTRNVLNELDFILQRFYNCEPQLTKVQPIKTRRDPEYVAHACLFGEGIRIVNSLDLNKCLKEIATQPQL